MIKVHPLTADINFADIKKVCDSGIHTTVMLRLAKEHADASPEIAEKIAEAFRTNRGVLFFLEPTHIVFCIDADSGHTPADLRREIAKELKDYQYHILIRHTSTGMLEKLEKALEKPMEERGSLYKARLERSGKVFMIVDDDMFIRKVMNENLANFGTVHEYSDGDKVVEDYRNINPDIIFLDIHIHGIDGLEVLKKIQSMDLDSKIVILSSDASESKVRLAQTSGASTFLRKPAPKERIAECIKLAYFNV